MTTNDTFKRTNWTTEEVIELIKGQKIVNSDGKEDEYCQQHNQVIDHITDCLYDFIRPVTEFGAMGLCNEDGQIYHIGGIPEEHAEEWQKQRIKNDKQ